jgi:hypothetical protein
MDVSYPGFGTILVEGTQFDHDIVMEGGRVRPRNKKPSRGFRSRYGHTPCSIGEDIPWSPPQLIVGTGASGRLPIMPEVWEEAERRGIEVVAVPTSEACRLLESIEAGNAFAILHVTC